ncbi:helix-turn-helix transcriptional regulator [Bacteroides congonensis]|uniref:helix-turn-helix domain-containing protein n=1 Tax=Bacteroides congonensis TaxID=1871006 RepID=UPI003219EA26
MYYIKKRKEEGEVDVREYIKLCCVKRGNISEAELARRTGQTPQNMNNKYKRNTFKISELEKVADALEADLKISFVDKKSGEPII